MFVIIKDPTKTLIGNVVTLCGLGSSIKAVTSFFVYSGFWCLQKPGLVRWSMFTSWVDWQPWMKAFLCGHVEWSGQAGACCHLNRRGRVRVKCYWASLRLILFETMTDEVIVKTQLNQLGLSPSIPPVVRSFLHDLSAEYGHIRRIFWWIRMRSFVQGRPSVVIKCSIVVFMGNWLYKLISISPLLLCLQWGCMYFLPLNQKSIQKHSFGHQYLKKTHNTKASR